MELAMESTMGNGEAEEMDREPSGETLLGNTPLYRSRFPGMVRQKAYIFDGYGEYYNKEWDLAEGRNNEFCWYHIELPKSNQKLSLSAQCLIDVLCPPLKLQDILSLVSNGPFCGHVDGALVFRVNSPGPPSSNYTFRLAARVTENSVITVSLGRVPRLGFSPVGQSLLSEIPSVETPSSYRGEQKEGSGPVIREHVLEFLLTMNHSEEADNPVPRSVSNLVVHIIDTHVDHLQDVVTKLEMELDAVELELDKGNIPLNDHLRLPFLLSPPPLPPGKIFLKSLLFVCLPTRFLWDETTCPFLLLSWAMEIVKTVEFMVTLLIDLEGLLVHVLYASSHSSAGPCFRHIHSIIILENYCLLYSVIVDN